MQVVIDIEKGEYEHIKNGCFDYWGAEAVHNAIANGTPLPEGHSRLIEEDAALDVLRRSGYLAPEALWYYKNVFKDVKTIIPADKEE